LKRNRLLSTIAGGVAVSVLAFAGTAHADQPVDDIAKIVENVPAAVNVAVDGVQASVDKLIETSSAKQTSARLGQALVATGTALVSGTVQFGALGLGFTLINSSVQSALAPYLDAIDDPSTAGGLINPDDLQTILNNLAPTVENTKPALVMGLVDLLEGDVYNGVGNVTVSGVLAAGELTNGTNYQSLIAPAAIVVLVAIIAGGSYLTDIGDALAPVFEAAAPATGSVIALLEAL